MWMLEPRIYRSALVPVVLALVVVAFSLYDQKGPLATSLAPDAFNAQNAYTTMTALANGNPDRTPGSPSDAALASSVSQAFARRSFSVTTDTSAAQTAAGRRTIETVSAVRAGFSGRPIVVVAHRDASGSPAIAEMSGTATLLELARVLSGRTLNRTVVLVSTSGSVGAAGAARVAHSFGTTPDAVVVLGDLASSHLRYPLVTPWSNGQDVAPPGLRNTVAAALGAQGSLSPGGLSFGGQFARLAFPLSLGEQGPFGAAGTSAVLLSASGEREPAPDAAYSLTRLTAFGRAALQTISALEDGRDIPAPGPYLIWNTKVVPPWAIRVLVLALILPVLAAGIDGYARARRRGYAVEKGIGWVLAAAVPFALGALLVLALKLTGLLHPTPPGPVDAKLVPPHAAGIAIMTGIALVVLLALLFLRPALGRLARVRGETGNGGAAVAVALVMSAVTLAIWVGNPFAAALVVPALHLWAWVVAPELRLRSWLRLVLLLIGLVPLGLVLAYYAVTLGLSPVGLAWSGTLMLAGGHLSVVTALEWSVVLGCSASGLLIALHLPRQRHEADQPITVRGPVTYAGPGSLGGTESALRR